MNTERAIRKLDRLLRSRAPVVYVVSHEEARVTQAIAGLTREPVIGMSGDALLPGGDSNESPDLIAYYRRHPADTAIRTRTVRCSRPLLQGRARGIPPPARPVAGLVRRGS